MGFSVGFSVGPIRYSKSAKSLYNRRQPQRRGSTSSSGDTGEVFLIMLGLAVVYGIGWVVVQVVNAVTPVAIAIAEAVAAFWTFILPFLPLIIVVAIIVPLVWTLVASARSSAEPVVTPTPEPTPEPVVTQKKDALMTEQELAAAIATMEAALKV